MERNNIFFKTLSGTLMIAGTTIGAGMLGIPLATAQAGFFPAVVVTIAVWAFMAATGLLMAEVSLNMPEGSNILSISQKFLGRKGKYFAGALFIFLYYCLLVAYSAGGTPLLDAFFKNGIGLQLPPAIVHVTFAGIFALVVACGMRWIDRVNFILTIALVFSYAALIGGGADAVNSSRLVEGNWQWTAFAVPILFSAFGYHNVIPSMATYLKKDRKALIGSILLGTSLALVVYLVWQWLILGALSQESLLQALREGQTATQALQSVTGNRWIYPIGQAFAFFALVTSMLGVAFSMVDFLGDGLKVSRKGLSRFGLTLLTFAPPAFFAWMHPNIFDRALGVAGGIGEACLNGLLPALFVWIGRSQKASFRIVAFPFGKIAVGFLIALSILVVLWECHILLMA